MASSSLGTLGDASTLRQPSPSAADPTRALGGAARGPEDRPQGRGPENWNPRGPKIRHRPGGPKIGSAEGGPEGGSGGRFGGGPENHPFSGPLLCYQEGGFSGPLPGPLSGPLPGPLFGPPRRRPDFRAPQGGPKIGPPKRAPWGGVLFSGPLPGPRASRPLWCCKGAAARQTAEASSTTNCA